MVWEEEHQYTGVIQEVRQTLGGRSHVYSRNNTGPMPITLASLDDQGWVTVATVRMLEAMARDASGSYTLQLGTRTYDTYFRHYEPPVVSAKLLIPRSEPKDDDLCTLTLKLVTYTP
jgi:hypothetical protein